MGYGLFWAGVNTAVASLLHFAIDVPVKYCFNFYVAGAFLVYGIYEHCR